jgi:branched-chain amino acid transport system substrate-binding protein
MLAALSLAIAGCDDGGHSQARNTLRLGALLSLTGDWASLGQNSRAALGLAVDDVNADLSSRGEDLRVELSVEDTKLVPDLADSALQRLADDGVRVVIGPQSSAEVRAIADDAESLGVLVVSQGSTAHSLAIAGDNVFRLCPDDVQEGAAVAALLAHDGIETIVGATRDDPGNQGLQTSTRAAFEARGGTVADVFVYAPGTTDFSATLSDLEAHVAEAVAARGASAVAIYLTAFDEAAMVFAQAAASETLSGVRWYGSDGVAGSAPLLAESSASFASSVGYPCPIFGLDPTNAERWEPIAAAVRAETDIDPDAFALSTYDAVFVAAEAYLQAGGVDDIDAYKQAFAEIAADYVGITGPLTLNEAGDRATGPFDFDAICPANGEYEWMQVGTFLPGVPDAQAISFAGCPS